MQKSNFLSLNVRDFLKGLVMVLITALITGIYQLLEAGTVFTWETIKPVLITSATAGLGYLLKNLLTNSAGEILTTEKSPLAVKLKNSGKYTKLLILIFILSGAGLISSAQSLTSKVPDDLFKVHKTDLVGASYNAVSELPGKWILRLNTGVMGVSYELKKGSQPVPLSAILFGLGYFYYKNVNGEPWNVWGVNGGVLMNTQNVGFGAGLFGTYNTNAVGLLNAGLHYDWSLNKVFLDTGISYKF